MITNMNHRMKLQLYWQSQRTVSILLFVFRSPMVLYLHFGSESLCGYFEKPTRMFCFYKEPSDAVLHGGLNNLTWPSVVRQ